MVGWEAENEGGTVSPVCPLEHLNAQFDFTAKLMRCDGRTGESRLWGAILIPALHLLSLYGKTVTHQTPPHPELVNRARCKHMCIAT